MATVNASRRGIAANMNDAVEGAKLVGFKSDGTVCLWFGGYGFNVYDAARDWHEVDHFTSGDIAGISDTWMDADEEKRGLAKRRMESEGFTVVE